MNDICEDIHRRRWRDPVTGILTKEEWFNVDGHHHHDDGPAITEFDRTTGSVVHESWFILGIPHRIDGPAKRRLDAITGDCMSETWYQNGVLHRVDGPAVIWRNEDGIVDRREYYLLGAEINENDPALNP